jgi:ribonuclease HI
LAQAARQRLKEREGFGGAAEPAPGEVDEAAVALSIAVSCLDSVGPGAWAVVLREGPSQTVLHGQRREATSNALYLEAALQGLRAVPDRRPVVVYAASDYLIRGASEWAPRWQRSGWRTRGGSEVQNRESWEALLEAAAPHRVSWQLASRGENQDDVAEAKRIASREAARLAR